MIKPQDTLLGRFRVEKLLGQGGMGTVVAARHIELDELFAIKLLRPELLEKQAFVSRFLHEARAAARLRSPHIARVYDVGKLEDGVPYMVMEYLEGCDLRRLLKRHGAIPLAHAARLMLQACDALAEAHAAGIIHRDLKLDNLFLTHRRGAPCLKVLDFGISKNAHVNQGLTRSGVLMGSPLYMSPEQMKNPRDVDPRADIWAMGVSLYELLTTATPFDGEVLVELIFHVLTHMPSAPSALCAELPQDVDELILRCLAKDPEERFADKKQPELGRAAARVMQADAPVHLATEHAFKLISLGVARPTDKGVVAGRALYRAYLSTRLTSEGEARPR